MLHSVRLPLSSWSDVFSAPCVVCCHLGSPRCHGDDPLLGGYVPHMPKIGGKKYRAWFILHDRNPGYTICVFICDIEIISALYILNN